MKLVAVPIELHEACAVVANYHRHSKPPRGHRWSVGCSDGEELAGVAIVGRPVSRYRADGFTAEILRCCVLPSFQRNGPKGRSPHPSAPAGAHASAVASFLYAACWRAWRAMGGRRLITYSLKSEGGESLRAAGFRVIGEVSAASGAGWTNRPGREWQPVYGQPKFTWARDAA